MEFALFPPFIVFFTGGQDYTFEPITIDFQSGNVLPVTVVIFADIISEGMENFTLLLSTVEDYVIVTSATATVAIFDNRGM